MPEPPRKPPTQHVHVTGDDFRHYGGIGRGGLLRGLLALLRRWLRGRW